MMRVQSGTVLKYLPPERVDILESGTIRFTQLNALNDPFEAWPRLAEFKVGTREALFEKASQRWGPGIADALRPTLPAMVDHYVDQLQDVMSQAFAFLSLSKRNDSLVMWSYYADSHKGLVLGFDASSTFFQPGNGKGRHGLCEISYSQTRPVIPVGGVSQLNSSEAEQLNEALFYQKSDHWSYEEELRILAHPDSADIKKPDKTGVPIYLFRFPPEAVVEVILGLRIHPLIAAQVADVVSKKYHHARLLQAQRHDRKFALEFVTYAG